jgi:Na+/H+ antiporter NhaD/arsenite permease-like protein
MAFTIIGASANILSGGICAQGKPIRFKTFLRYGLPLTLTQPTVAAIYVLTLHYML